MKRYDDAGRFGEGEDSRLSFRTDKPYGAHLLETPLTKDQEVRDLDDEYEITAGC